MIHEHEGKPERKCDMKMKLSRIGSIVVLAAMLASASKGIAGPSPTEETPAFRDQNQIGEEYRIEVALLAEMGIMNGYADRTFQPQQRMTRAEFAKLVYTITNGQEKEERSEGKYVDVSDQHWAKKYIDYCRAQGYMGGVGGNRFDPEGFLIEKNGKAVIDRIMPGYEGSWRFESTYSKEDHLEAFATREELARLIYESLFRANPSDARLYGEEQLGFRRIEGLIVANEEIYYQGERNQPGPLGISPPGKSTLYTGEEYLTIHQRVPNALIGEEVEFLSYPTVDGEIGIAADACVKRRNNDIDRHASIAVVMDSQYDREKDRAIGAFYLLGDDTLTFSEQLSPQTYVVSGLPVGEEFSDFAQDGKLGAIYYYERQDGEIDLSVSSGSKDMSQEKLLVRNGILYINETMQWFGTSADMILLGDNEDGPYGKIIEKILHTNDMSFQAIQYKDEGLVKKLKRAAVLYEENSEIIRAVMLTTKWW